MFDSTCLYQKPLIQMRNGFKGSMPEDFLEMHSSQFWYHMESDFIDKIVAMRVYPYQNCVVLKLRPRNTDEYVSIVLKDPELRILKRLWDCGHDGFNFAVKYYLTYSSSAAQQWITGAKHSPDCMDWFLDLTAEN